jgi:hypothetical protein
MIDPEDPKMRTQVNRATRLIHSSARWARSLRDNFLVPEVSFFFFLFFFFLHLPSQT